MYVSVKGGERAIRNAHQLLAKDRRGDPAVPAMTLAQITEQLTLAVDRVMAEGSLYDRDLAALAVRQSRGDLIEAIFLLRAYRTTLTRLGASEPVDTGRMRLERRVSATFKDLPGGQVLGPTFDYTHRLLEEGEAPDASIESAQPQGQAPRVTDVLGADGLIEPDGVGEVCRDLTREAIDHPMDRDVRLQALARADEGWLLGLAYSTQRGYGRNHPFVGEIRIGAVEVNFFVPELGFAVTLGTVTLTECQVVNQFAGGAGRAPQFTRGYGLAFGRSERKTMAMALVDRALRASEFGEDRVAPAQDEEFVIAHCDNVQSMGFVEHLKLPHYVDFQSELQLLRTLRAEHTARAKGEGEGDGKTEAEAAE